MSATLKVLIPNGRIIPLPKQLQTIGRSADCNIVLENSDGYILDREPNKGASSITTVSRLHAQLIRINGELAIIDAGSLNGTRVNDEPISNTPKLLQDGDRISLAAVNLLFQEDKTEHSSTAHIGTTEGL